MHWITRVVDSNEDPPPLAGDAGIIANGARFRDEAKKGETAGLTPAASPGPANLSRSNR